MSSALQIAVSLIAFTLATLAFVLTLVGRAMRRRTAAEMAILEAEGIARDSGFVGGSARYRDFRAPGVHTGAGISTTRRRLVLTARQLAILGGKTRFHIPRAELARYQVGVLDGRLQLVTDAPHGATGHIDLRLAVADPERWFAMLRAAGCTASA